MPRIKLKRVDGISRKLVSDAYSSFMRHAQLHMLFALANLILADRPSVTA